MGAIFTRCHHNTLASSAHTIDPTSSKAKLTPFFQLVASERVFLEPKSSLKCDFYDAGVHNINFWGRVHIHI